jgi:hypothetical protein
VDGSTVQAGVGPGVAKPARQRLMCWLKSWLFVHGHPKHALVTAVAAIMQTCGVPSRLCFSTSAPSLLAAANLFG